MKASLRSKLLAAGVLGLAAVAGLPAAAPSEARAAVAGSAATYLRQALSGDLFEVEGARIALEKARREDVKALARLMLADHARSTSALKTAAGQDSISAPTSLRGPAYGERLKQLQDAGPDGFDRLYVDMLVERYTGALRLHRTYADTGEGARLRATAAGLADTAERNLALARKLKAKLDQKS